MYLLHSLSVLLCRLSNLLVSTLSTLNAVSLYGDCQKQRLIMIIDDDTVPQDKRDAARVVGVVPGRAAARGAVHGGPHPGQRRAHHRRGRARAHGAGAGRAGPRPVARGRPRPRRDPLHQHLQVSAFAHFLFYFLTS